MIHYDIFETMKNYLKEGDRVIELGDQEVNLAEAQGLTSQEYFDNIETVS